ncbi:SDR family oxidoreductase [Pseudomonas sp. HY13-MNA-CIBAN-0226]|uniref:SDR family oxidoreductase n=1 Tax=Pseudomonas sp. HY13-MNA-CIBAN-0226 TaxID=3140473 RepID=UPI00332266C3
MWPIREYQCYNGCSRRSSGEAAYAAAKAGMAVMSRSLAHGTARCGTVNSVAPGGIATGSSAASEFNAAWHTPLHKPGALRKSHAGVIFSPPAQPDSKPWSCYWSMLFIFLASNAPPPIE